MDGLTIKSSCVLRKGNKMKYFLLLLCVFYTTEGFAQGYKKFKLGQEVAVRRSSGGFSNAVVMGVGSSDWVTVHITEPDGTTATKDVNVNNTESYSREPLRTSTGHLRRNEVVSLPRTAGGRANGYVKEIQGQRVRVVWPNEASETGYSAKWIDITEVDRPMPSSPNRRGRRSGRMNIRGGGMWMALLGLGSGFYAVVKDGVVSAREVQDRTMKALDDALMTASITASEIRPDVANFNKLLDQMHQTADYFIENNLPMSSRQRQSILAMLDQARSQFGGGQDPPSGMSRIEQQKIYDKITAFRSKLQKIGRDHPQNTGSTSTQQATPGGIR